MVVQLLRSFLSAPAHVHPYKIVATAESYICNVSMCVRTCRALLEEALQLERQLHVALLADKLNQEEEDKQQQQQQNDRQEPSEQDKQDQQQQEADADAAAASSLAIPGGLVGAG